jgi:hypothetical protein
MLAQYPLYAAQAESELGREVSLPRPGKEQLDQGFDFIRREATPPARLSSPSLVLFICCFSLGSGPVNAPQHLRERPQQLRTVGVSGH